MIDSLPEARTLTISLAIPTYRRGRILVETIRQVLSQSCIPDEILVIDQTEDHDRETKEYLYTKDREGAIRWVRHNPPGLAGARNRALFETRCDIIIFIDDDVCLADDFVRNHLRNYEERPHLTAVAGRVTQRLGWLAPKNPPPHPNSLDYKYMDPDSPRAAEPVGAFAGGNHSIRVQEAKLLGGYDEQFRGAALREETDLSIRLLLAGKTIRYDPSAFLYHMQVSQGGCRLKSIYDGSACRSLLYFAFKHLGTLGVDARHDVWQALRLFVLNRRTVIRPDALLFNGIRFLLYMARYGVLCGIPSLFLSDRA